MSHTQSSHQGFMVREGLAVVKVLAYGGFQSFAGYVEPRNCLIKGSAKRNSDQIYFLNCHILKPPPCLGSSEWMD